MIKKIGLLCIALCLVGCASQVENKHFYQLPDLVSHQSQVQQNYKGIIFVQPITLAELLSNSGIVYQLNDVEYSIANDNLWSQPLDAQLVTATVQNLSAQLPDWLVMSRQIGSEETRIVVKGIVSHFNGRFDGTAEIKGGWVVTYYPHSDATQQSHSKIIYLPFEIVLPQAETGYDSLVKTLAVGWQDNVKKLAEAIKHLNIGAKTSDAS